MKAKYALFFSFAVIVTLSACKKTEEPVDNSYKCLCGSVTWLNEPIQLTDISYIQIWPDSLFSRQYYATAEMRDSRFEIAHSIQIEGFVYLDATIRRVMSADAPMHYAPNLVAAYLPSIHKTVKVVKEVMYLKK